MPTETPSDIDANEILKRLRHANVVSVQRASNDLMIGMSVLHNQFELPKTSKWQNETAWVLDGIRANAVDGLDLKQALGYSTESENKSDKSYIAKASKQAKQALFSTASPMAAAVALSKNLEPLIAKCNEIITSLKNLVESEQQADRDTGIQLKQDAPKDSSAPSKKGL